MDDLFQEEKNQDDAIARSLTRVDELAYDLRVREVMSDQLKTVTPEMTMNDVLNLLRQEHISGAPVVLDGKLIGVISLEDLIRSMTAGDLAAQVSKYMTTDVIAVNGYDAVIEAVKAFTRFKVGRLPVLNRDGKLVGMITKGDITRGVLNALQQGYHKEELRRYRASHLFEDIISDRTSLILRYRILPGDFINGGNASSLIKRALLRLGANPQIARRCGIAIYEAEMNLIIHTTNGGLIRLEIEPHRILMQAIDDGPGIPDIQLAMQPGYSTAPEEVRELGFGAGMGLVNIQRCVDKMQLRSTPEMGTKLEMKIYLQYDETLKESSLTSAEEKK
ncbi:MAG TPA: CBS domain-containing protein [Anaerolineales bacterium]|nr:CBS domain-containing protein [Anaerolineales bacterium]